MQIIKLLSDSGRPKSYKGIKVIFDDSTSILFNAVQIMPFIRRNYREDQNLSKYPLEMINAIREVFNKPPLKFKTYEYVNNVFISKVYR